MNADSRIEIAKIAGIAEIGNASPLTTEGTEEHEPKEAIGGEKFAADLRG
jgi:hypothetical protein